jgi:hypothetical protein
MTEGTPDRINHAALERIIRRAAELQTSERDVAETLSPDEVLALGREVGIPGRYLQQALIEERMRVAVRTPSGLLERVAGPSVVMAQRVVQADPDAVQGTLVRWMDEHELLVVQRQQRGWVTWEPVTGFQAAVRRSTAAFGGGRKPFMLSKVDTVTGTITPLEEGYCHVALSAEVRKARTAMIAGSVAVASFGVAATGVMLALGAMTVVALAPLPGAVAMAYGVMRQHPPRIRRVQLGLERALDHLEGGGARARLTEPRPPSIVNLIADEVRKAIKSSRSGHG